MSALSDRQKSLLKALRGAEAAGGPVDLDVLVEATGYSAASIRTYFSKKLDGVLVFRLDEGWEVRGAQRCTEADFARLMTQKAGAAADALNSEESWRRLVRKLLYEGRRRNYQLGPDEAVIARALLPERS